MTDQQIADEVKEILTRYRVHNHYQASSAQVQSQGSRSTFYAVWTGSKQLGTLQQVTDPTSHREAQECRTGLIAADIIELIEKARAA